MKGIEFATFDFQLDGSLKCKCGVYSFFITRSIDKTPGNISTSLIAQCNKCGLQYVISNKNEKI